MCSARTVGYTLSDFIARAKVLRKFDVLMFRGGEGGGVGREGGYRSREFARQDSDLATRLDGYVEISSHEVTKFKSWSSAELSTAVDSLHEARARLDVGTITVRQFDDLQKVIGLNYNPTGLLSDMTLRAHIDWIGVCTYDWVHTCLQDGVYTIEVQAFLKAHARFGVTRGDIERFLGDEGWVFPMFSRTKSRQLHRVFDERRISAEKPDRIKCGASELLGLYGLLRHYVEVHVGHVAGLEPQRASFDAACNVLDSLLSIKRSLIPARAAARRLTEAVVAHLELHKLAYGTVFVRPKHHWLLDVPAQIFRDGCVVDAFVVERQHLMVKSVAEHIKNTSSFEHSLMASVCTLQLSLAKEADFSNRLHGNLVAVPNCPGIVVGTSLTVFGIVVSVGDVIVRAAQCGLVSACCVDNGELFAIVEALVEVGRQAAHARLWRRVGRQEVWPAEEVEHCIAWYAEGDSWVVVER
jgi:hypothetical protein